MSEIALNSGTKPKTIRPSDAPELIPVYYRPRDKVVSYRCGRAEHERCRCFPPCVCYCHTPL